VLCSLKMAKVQISYSVLEKNASAILFYWYYFVLENAANAVKLAPCGSPITLASFQSGRPKGEMRTCSPIYVGRIAARPRTADAGSRQSSVRCTTRTAGRPCRV